MSSTMVRSMDISRSIAEQFGGVEPAASEEEIAEGMLKKSAAFAASGNRRDLPWRLTWNHRPGPRPYGGVAGPLEGSLFKNRSGQSQGLGYAPEVDGLSPSGLRSGSPCSRNYSTGESGLRYSPILFPRLLCESCGLR